MSSHTFYNPPIVTEGKKRDAGVKKAAVVSAAIRRSGMMERVGGRGDDRVGTVAVAVDGDRSSQHALKWAADHVLSRKQFFFLLHVRRKHTSIHYPGGKPFSTAHVQEDLTASFHAHMDLQTKEMLLPFQCFCGRRGLQCREIILDGTDVPKAIVDFVVQHSIDKVVLGTSSRNAFTRTIWKMDVPTSVTKYAPNFCSVYVISKGKLSSFRPATQPNISNTSQEDLNPHATGNQLLAAKSGSACDIPGGEPSYYRPMSTPAVMHTGASSDESTEDGNIMSSHQQRHVDSSSLVKTSSCPTEFLRSVSQQSSYFSPEHPASHRDVLFLLTKDKEQGYQTPHRKYLGIDDNCLEYNARDPLSPIPSGEYSASTSDYQSVLSTPSHLPEDAEAEIIHFKRQMKQKDGAMIPWNYKEFPLGTKSGMQNSYEILEQANERTFESSLLNLPNYRSADAEPSSLVRDLKHKLLTLETSSSDPRRNFEEFKDGDYEKHVHPMLSPLPPKFYSPNRHGSPSEDKHTLNCQPLPRPIETKRMLECLPTILQCRLYTPEEIARATDHFSVELKVGEGGYGPVYKATLDNTLVAVKILHSNVTQGLKQFQQEIDLLNNLRHPNMVHLVGACPEYGCLVYEYMPNGSLDDRLFCRSGSPPLPWQLRFKIAVEIASGLLYLHKMKPEAFVHRDLKPGNILLGEDFVTKISDVGLARIIPRSLDDTMTTQYCMTDAAGTFCYIDPEYQKTGLVSTKSDVYALGIIYLQLITAKDAMGLAYAVSDALEEGTFEEVLDHNVVGWPVEETKKFAELALKCCELRHRDRPDLESVVLPELIRLYTLAVLSKDPSTDQSHQRSASNKDLPLDDGLAGILNDDIVKAASFAA